MGVAVLGSVVAAVYRGELSDRLSALPAGPRQLAGESIEGTMAVAARLGAAGRGLIDPAQAAFVHGVHTAAAAAAVIAFIGALMVFKWMPGRPAATRREESVPERETAGV